MALQKQNIPISFARGINTKVDNQQVEVGSFTLLENVVFDTVSKMQKRNGYESINRTLTTGEKIVDSKVVTTFENELCLINPTKFYSQSSSVNRWVEKGNISNVVSESDAITRNNREQSNIDCLSIENINVFVYQDSTGVRVSVRDRITNNFILADALVDASGELPRVANIQNDVFLFYQVSGDLKYRKFGILDPASLGSATAVVSDLNTTNKKFEVTSASDRVIFAYNSSDSGGVLKLGSVDGSETVSSITTVTGEVPSGALAISCDSNSRVLISYYDGSDVKVNIRSFLLTAELLAPTSIETISNVVNVDIIESSTSNYQIIYEISATNTYDHFIKKNSLTLAGSVGTPSVLKRSVGLASKQFIFNDTIYMLVVHQSTLQSSYFLINSSGELTTKISPSLGGDLINANGVPHVATISSDTFLIATQVKGRVVTDTGKFDSLLGVNSTEIDFDVDDPYQNKTQGQTLHIASGIVKMYDGKEVVEHGFHIFPENVELDSSPTTGGALEDGTYLYSAVYVWTDNKGNIHQSAPSTGLSVTLSGATSTQKPVIQVPTLRLTDKENVVIDLYRSEKGGTIQYRVTTVAAPTFNDTTVDSVTIEDTVSDADIVSRETLYTTGGVLENIAAPSGSIIEAYNRRLFLAGLEDGNKMQYSKITSDGKPVEFNDTLVVNVNPFGGPITALKELDDKLIIFKENAIYYMSGDGPNNLGVQDTFTEPEQIASDVGCVDKNSVVLTPDGVMFRSNKGFYLLSRGLGTQFIGAAVEQYDDVTIASAEVIRLNNQVRFLAKNGRTLIYDYFVQQWSSFSNHMGRSATVLGSNYYYIRTNGDLFKETPGVFTDNGTAIKIRFTTGWLSFARLQGFQRVYKMLFLGKFKSAHRVKVQVAYDFNESFVQQKIIDTADFDSGATYGSESPYGTGTPYGGDGNVHQFRLDFQRQKCESIKITFEDIQTTDGGEALSLSNMAFEVGGKAGTNKLDSNRKYATS